MFTRILCIFTVAFATLVTAGIKEDFESYPADKGIKDQGGWKEGLYGGHPSCKVVSTERDGKTAKVLTTPGGRDFHVYCRFPADVLKPVLSGKVIRVAFSYKGNARFGVGNVNYKGAKGITVSCRNKISVIDGKQSFSGIGSVDARKWNRVILIFNKVDNKVELSVGVASPESSGKYVAVYGLENLKLSFPTADVAKWNGVYLRIDAGAMFDDLELEAFDSKTDVPEKFSGSTKDNMVIFKPILDHIAAPRTATDLCGIWQYLPTDVNVAMPPESGWQNVMVPDTHSGLFRKPIVWFRRNFELPEKNPNQQYFLCFERVTDCSDIYLNGQKIGSSKDGHFQFKVNATSAIKPGKNQLLVRVAGSSVNGGPTVRPSGWGWFLAHYRGIQYPVHLETTGKVAVDDVFIISRLHPQSSLEAKITLTNYNSNTQKITLNGKVDSEFKFRPVSVALKAGESREVKLSGDWKTPHLWWPHDPHLYYLDLTVSSNGKVVDAYRQRFGFRELAFKGPDMLINGVRFLHRRNSMIPYRNYSNEKELRPYIALQKKRGYNGMRLHGGPSLRVIRIADETGFLIAPESAVNEPRGNAVKPEFWSNAKQHIHNMVKSLRNHPSIIYWCLSNEFASYYMKGSKEEKAKVDAKMLKFGEMTQQLDPTRTWTCSGDGSLGGWGHDGPAPTLSFHYPTEPFKSRFTVPVDAYWLSGKTVSWHGIKWKQQKPLIFSEDLYMPYGIKPPGGMARWAGDKAYDITKGYYEGWFECIRAFAEGYYHDKLSGWNPWATDPGNPNNPLYENRQPMPDYLLCTREMNSTFASGKKVKRKLFAYNEMFANQNCTLKANLIENDKVINTIEKQFILPAGGKESFNVSLQMPKVPKKTPVQWKLTLSANGKKLTSRTYDYTVYPRKAITAPKGCVLLSNNSNTLPDVKFPKGRYSSLSQALKSGVTSLVIANWKANGNDSKELTKAVGKGLKVLWLEPDTQVKLPLRLCKNLKETYVFVQSHSDPAMKNISDNDLKLWGNDYIPVKTAFIKPVSGMFDILADSGTAQMFTNIVRVYNGKGYYLLCSLPVISRYTSEPAAAYVAKQLISSCNHSPVVTQGILDITNAGKATAALKKFGIPTESGKSGKVLWIDGNLLENSGEQNRISECCSHGGTAIIDGVNKKTAEQLSSLTGENVSLVSVQATDMIKTGKYPELFAGIANNDMYWRQSNNFDTEAKKLSRGQKFTSKDRKMLDQAIVANGKISAPVKPAGIAIMPFKSGKLVLLTIKWQDFLKLRPKRTSRLIVSLLHNIGVLTSSGAGELKDYNFVAMNSVMNRELWQQKNGPVAWFGKAGEDMRYFPVNRPGIDPILNLPQPAEAFPTEAISLGGIDFKLTDPSKNNGKCSLVLSTGKSTVIPVNAKFNKVWMLGALEDHDRKGTVSAKVVYNYSNGSSATANIKAGIHINGYKYLTEMDLGICAWNGPNQKRPDNVLWTWSLNNPHPDRNVKSITLKVTGKKSLALIGMTLER